MNYSSLSARNHLVAGRCALKPVDLVLCLLTFIVLLLPVSVSSSDHPSIVTFGADGNPDSVGSEGEIATASLVEEAPGIQPPRFSSEDRHLDPASTLIASRLRWIYIYGNRRTKDEIIRAYLDLDSGAVVDSALIAAAKKRVESTGLFAKVEIFPVRMPEATDLRVIVIEELYFSITDVGGEFLRRYGTASEDAEKWWQRGRVRFAFTQRNFRGRLETLKLSMTLLEWRSLSLSWYKPFLSTPYFLQASIGLSDNPSFSDSLRGQTVSGALYGGMNFPNRSRVYTSLASVLRNTRDERNDPEVDRRFTETVLSAGWSIDRRNRRFDPLQGFTIGTRGKISVVAPEEDAWRRNEDIPLSRNYGQIEVTSKFFVPGFWPRKGDVFATRGKVLLRNTEGGILNRISAGGESSIRGTSGGSLDAHRRGNNLLLLSGEYRFPIWKTPPFHPFSMFDFSTLGYDLKSFYYRFDGSVFVDGAYVWEKWDDPLGGVHQKEKAITGGVGLKLVMPTVGQIISFDIVPVFWNGSFDWGTKMNRPQAQWFFHLYLGTSY